MLVSAVILDFPNQATHGPHNLQRPRLQVEGPSQYIHFAASLQIFDQLRLTSLADAVGMLPFCPETDAGCWVVSVRREATLGKYQPVAGNIMGDHGEFLNNSP